MKLVIQNIEELDEKAIEFLHLCKDIKIFAFEGEMGAGKTTFILSILKALNIEELEGSPTYSLVNSYTNEKSEEIYHFDLYRLNSEMEALDIGIEEMLYGDSYCFIEWPSKIKNLLPENTLWVNINVNTENNRTLSFEL